MFTGWPIGLGAENSFPEVRGEEWLRRGPAAQPGQLPRSLASWFDRLGTSPELAATDHLFTEMQWPQNSFLRRILVILCVTRIKSYKNG